MKVSNNPAFSVVYKLLRICLSTAAVCENTGVGVENAVLGHVKHDFERKNAVRFTRKTDLKVKQIFFHTCLSFITQLCYF